MNLDEINPVDKIKKGFNTFKNGFKGKSKEGFSNDELSTDENAYLSNIDKHPKFAVNTKPTNTVKIGYADLNGGVKVKITFEKLDEETTNATKTRKVTGLTITNPGTGSNYKAGDTIVITTDKIKDKSDTTDPTGIYIDDAKASAERAGNGDDYVGSEDNALRFTITDTSENDWGKFIGELISLFILLIIFSILGANMVHLSNSPMRELDSLLPSDWNSAPYRGEYLKGANLFKKLNDSETREDLLEFLFPMKSVSFPYTYDSMYRNDELDDLGLAFYVIWPLKWLARTTAWAWSTGRLLMKYFIAFLKWIMTYIKTDSIIFFLGPFLLMFALSTQLTTMIGTILMYIGGFMTDVKDGWVLAIFALIIFTIAISMCIYGCYNNCMRPLWQLCQNIIRCCKGIPPEANMSQHEKDMREQASNRKTRLAEVTESLELEKYKAETERQAGLIAAANPINAISPSVRREQEESARNEKKKDAEGADAALFQIFQSPSTLIGTTADEVKSQFSSLLRGGTIGLIPETVQKILIVLLGIVILLLAIFSISFSSMYNSANGLFMTIQLAIFGLVNLLFKNNGIALMKEIISKHIKGLTIVFILFSLAMARANLTTNISNSYIFAGILVIISIIFSMFNKDKK